MSASITNTTSSTEVQSTSWMKIVWRWMPTFLGFPLGGLLAELVGHVDDLGAAIGGGAISGAILGLAQWLGMRRTGPPPELWVIATAIGFAAGLGAGASAVDFKTNIASLATQGAICGFIVGSLQAAVLYRKLRGLALAWPPVVAGLWALGWTITSLAGIDVEKQYTTFGSSGALVVTAATSVLAIALVRQQQGGRQERGAQ